ncbi:MAG: signal peptide peptidase SppA [Planctomycetota bacterium]|nr:signal peptide peptidase SppA [Planctomycetota bacterium]
MSSLPPNQPPGNPPVPPPGVPPQEPVWHGGANYPSPREGRGASFFVAIFLGLLLLVSGGLNVLLLLLSVGSFAGGGMAGEIDDTGAIYDLVTTGGESGATNKVLRIPIKGAISEAQSPVLGATGGMVSQVRRALRYAASDKSVRGILLDINSPGGGVTDSDEIYQMLQDFKQKHPEIKVAALLGDMAASGGYYIAVAAEWIVARRSTITGSIGVIMSAWNFAKLANEHGVTEVAIKSKHTPYKDMLSPMRDMTPEERNILLSIVEELYQQFVTVVADGRQGLTRERVQELANGAIYSAKQARDDGLVDEIGDMDSIEQWFRQRYDELQYVEYRRRASFRELLFGMQARTPDTDPLSALGRVLTASTGPRFLYYWQGAR